jgi:hypothetical protein
LPIDLQARPLFQPTSTRESITKPTPTQASVACSHFLASRISDTFHNEQSLVIAKA